MSTGSQTNASHPEGIVPRSHSSPKHGLRNYKIQPTSHFANSSVTRRVTRHTTDIGSARSLETRGNDPVLGRLTFRSQMPTE